MCSSADVPKSSIAQLFLQAPVHHPSCQQTTTTIVSKLWHLVGLLVRMSNDRLHDILIHCLWPFWWEHVVRHKTISHTGCACTSVQECKKQQLCSLFVWWLSDIFDQSKKNESPTKFCTRSSIHVLVSAKLEEYLTNIDFSSTLCKFDAWNRQIAYSAFVATTSCGEVMMMTAAQLLQG